MRSHHQESAMFFVFRAKLDHFAPKYTHYSVFWGQNPTRNKKMPAFLWARDLSNPRFLGARLQFFVNRKGLLSHLLGEVCAHSSMLQHCLLFYGYTQSCWVRIMHIPRFVGRVAVLFVWPRGESLALSQHVLLGRRAGRILGSIPYLSLWRGW
jgi:hypothetical protein